LNNRHFNRFLLGSGFTKELGGLVLQGGRSGRRFLLIDVSTVSILS
jgi:hypothetical protein